MSDHPDPRFQVSPPVSIFEADERKSSQPREYVEVFVVICAVTVAALYVAPTSHLPFGIVYLIAVVTLSMRVGLGPVIFAGLFSALMWDLFVIPPVGSLAITSFEDVLMLGAYVIVALVTGRSNARVRKQERTERIRERRATALLQLARALAEAKSFEQAIEIALRQADQLFRGPSVLLLVTPDGQLRPYGGAVERYHDAEWAAGEWAWNHGSKAGRYTPHFPQAAGHYLPLLRAQSVVGVLAVYLPGETASSLVAFQDLLDGLAAQIAMQIEREQLRVVTEREKLLAESEKLHRTLLDSVSHELRTPLAVLSTATAKLGTQNEANRAELAQEISTATGRLNRLVANLLNLNRLESGTLKPRLDWCNLRDLINDALRNTADVLKDHPVTVTIPPGLLLMQADPALLEQAITNLLHNAAFHTPAGTPVRIEGGIKDAPEPRICIAISDQGPGLPSELKDALFLKFQRGKQALPGGLGLGLSIVRGFVTAQGGEVVVSDRPGGGAVFSIYLPYHTPETVPEE
jgi:two-component system, OmpR family, sensor histidine kinase KdpD